MKPIEERKPLTEEEVIAYLNEEVKETEERWGVDYIYSRWARENRDKKLEAYRNGEVIEVCNIPYVDSYGNGCGNYEAILLSDGSVRTACYGYYD